MSVRRARVREAGGGGARPPAREGVRQEPECVSRGRWEGSGAPALSRFDFPGAALIILQSLGGFLLFFVLPPQLYLKWKCKIS